MALSNRLGWEIANHRSAAVAKHKLVPHLSNNTIDGRILHQLGCIKYPKNDGINYLTTYQLVQDFFHRQYHSSMILPVILTQLLPARPAGLSNRKASFLSVDISCSQDSFTGIVVNCCVLLWKQSGHPVDSSQQNPKTTQWNICWEYHCHLPTFPTIPAIHIQQPKVQLCHGFRLKRHRLRIHQPTFLCVFDLGSPNIHRQIVEGFPLPKTELPRSRYLLTSTWSPSHERENIRRSMSFYLYQKR